MNSQPNISEILKTRSDELSKTRTERREQALKNKRLQIMQDRNLYDYVILLQYVFKYDFRKIYDMKTYNTTLINLDNFVRVYKNYSTNDYIFIDDTVPTLESSFLMNVSHVITNTEIINMLSTCYGMELEYKINWDNINSCISNYTIAQTLTALKTVLLKFVSYEFSVNKKIYVNFINILQTLNDVLFNYVYNKYIV